MPQQQTLHGAVRNFRKLSRGLSDTRTAIVLVCAGLLLAVLVAAMSPRNDGARATTVPSPATGQFFDVARVWTVHLKFAPEQWDAMEPQGGPGPFVDAHRDSSADRLMDRVRPVDQAHLAVPLRRQEPVVFQVRAHSGLACSWPRCS